MKKYYYCVEVDDKGIDAKSEKEAYFYCGRLLERLKGTGKKIVIMKYNRFIDNDGVIREDNYSELFSIVANKTEAAGLDHFIEQ